MDEFIKQLNLVNKEKIREYLLSLKSPCYESELLKIAFPDMDIANASTLVLYQNHFILFHLLYILQNEFYKENKYLFVHFMRTFLASYPKHGICRFYDEYSGHFCGAVCSSNEDYCDFHWKRMEDNAIEELSDRYFYLDKKNFYSMNEETINDFLNGTLDMLNHYDDYERSLKILDISVTPDINLVKKKFRLLAKKYHPDQGGQSNEKFNEINRAYRLLLKMIPKMAG